jgi:hypothetical protein
MYRLWRAGCSHLRPCVILLSGVGRTGTGGRSSRVRPNARDGMVWFGVVPSVIGSGVWLVSTNRPPRRCETLDGARSGNVVAANHTRACYRPYRDEFDDETDRRRITQSQRVGHAGGGT